MFYKHLKISNEENEEESLYLFVDFDYEFGTDFEFKGKKEKIETIYNKVVNYIKEKKIDFKMGKVFLVVGGLVVGSLFISNYQFNNLKNSFEPKYKYVEQIDIFGENKTVTDIFQKEETIEQTNESKITTPIVKETHETSSYQEAATPPNKNIIDNVTPPAPEPPIT
ncbi:MAG: hypothetical protein PHD78_03525, partial [Bacilli bacterium]|nr:hypothetical protein [Bacilli bacterium]MDD4053849.1 hypothetical protein [Bacilli bacterium]MDD4411061.1 hypothetical protein [Bacilli bacterium]